MTVAFAIEALAFVVIFGPAAIALSAVILDPPGSETGEGASASNPD